MPEQIGPQLAYDDPLLSRHEFVHRQTFYPLGFPLTIETNSEEVLQAASESWCFFGQQFETKPMILSIGVSDGGGNSLPPAPVFRSRGHLLSIVADSSNFFHSDLTRGYQFGWITEAVANDSAFFRYYFLEVAAMTMIQQRHLAPIHGACVARNGRGVVLCGPSSAGKSTLAYACARAGWDYISDDATFLLRGEPGRNAIGNPHTIRFRESTKRLFPELFPIRSSLRANGTNRIEALTQNLPIGIASGCSLDHVVFVNRNPPGSPKLEPTTRTRAFEWFAGFACYGERRIREAQLKSYRDLLSASIWELQYRELSDALALLDQMARSNAELKQAAAASAER